MVTIQFHGTVHSNSSTQLEVNERKDLNILTLKVSNSITKNGHSITLDKKTAIKFCRELRRCISQLED
jgi:hypothetical protein